METALSAAVETDTGHRERRMNVLSPDTSQFDEQAGSFAAVDETFGRRQDRACADRFTFNRWGRFLAFHVEKQPFLIYYFDVSRGNPHAVRLYCSADRVIFVLLHEEKLNP